MKRRSQVILFVMLALAALLLTGCGGETASPALAPAPAASAAPAAAEPSPGAEVPGTEAVSFKHAYPMDQLRVEIPLEDVEDLCAQKERLPILKRITLTDPVTELSAVERLREAYPKAQIRYTVSVCGIPVKSTQTELDLSALGSGDTDQALQALGLLPEITSIRLSGEAMSFEDVGRFQALPSSPVVDYPFTLYDREFSTADDFMDLNRVRIYDKGAALREVLPYMTVCRQVDMEDCGISNEDMAALRDDFPNTKVVWRIHFSVYAARTDEKRILVSIKGLWLTAADVEPLKYCTEVRYLDIGHNTIEDISFVRNMPDLEVAIVAINYWKDASPLASCPKLEYLEIFNTGCSDLTPLAGLTNLKHLNICWLKNLKDISPIYGLTGLERLWIGCMTGVPQEQLDEVRLKLPKTKINTTVLNPTSDDWRRCERYQLLREQLGYDLPYPYSH